MGLDLYRSVLAQGRYQHEQGDENYCSVTADKFLTSCVSLLLKQDSASWS